MLLFAGGFMLAQPALVWVFTRVNARPFPIATREQWMNFLLFVAAVGAVAGALWHLAFRIQRRYLRWYVRSIPRFSTACCVMAYSLGQPYEWPIRFIAIITSALVMPLFSSGRSNGRTQS